MAVTRAASGTELIQDTDGEVTPTGATLTVTGGVRLRVDLNDVAAGELVIIRIKGPVLAAGTRRTIDTVYYGNVMGEDKIFQSDVYENIAGDTNDLSFTFETSGASADISIPWAWMSLGGS